MKNVSPHTADVTCRRIVRKLIEKYNWALLREDDLVELVLDAVQPAASPADLEKQTRLQYTVALYEACRQDEDPARRERGYRELFCYLYRAAYNRWPELAEDVTQRALLLVYEQIDHCRHPCAFLAFALGKLRHALQQEQRQQERRERDDASHLGEIPQGCTGTQLTMARSPLDWKEQLEVLLEAIWRLPDERKRKAIVLKYLGGLSDEEIGACLGITVANVRVLRHRGLARLRKDEQLREYFDIGDSEEIRVKEDEGS